MKRFCFLLLVYGLSTFHAFAQTHFITAGQTQGMIFTDYVPDSYIQTSVVNPSWDTGFVSIDINRDGLKDFSIVKGFSHSPGSSGFSYSLRPLDHNLIMAKYDSRQIVDHGVSYIDTFPLLVAKKFVVNDTLKDLSNTFWQNTLTLIYARHNGYGYYDWVATDSTLPLEGSYYYFLKTIYGTDTLAGYIHFSTYTNGLIMDFACEGPTSSYIITSTNNLSPTSISISPNPFNHQINIGTDKVVEYQVLDYTGRVLLSGKTERSIATEILPSGSYLLLLKNEELYSIKKMVKVKQSP